jgi:hypothetical protein
MSAGSLRRAYNFFRIQFTVDTHTNSKRVHVLQQDVAGSSKASYLCLILTGPILFQLNMKANN